MAAAALAGFEVLALGVLVIVSAMLWAVWFWPVLTRWWWPVPPWLEERWKHRSVWQTE